MDRILERFGIVHFDIGILNARLLGRLLKPVRHASRLGVKGVLLLHPHHQVSTAAQIQAQANVLVPVGDQFVLAPGQADDAVKADQNHSQDK